VAFGHRRKVETNAFLVLSCDSLLRSRSPKAPVPPPQLRLLFSSLEEAPITSPLCYRSRGRIAGLGLSCGQRCEHPLSSRAGISTPRNEAQQQGSASAKVAAHVPTNGHCRPTRPAQAPVCTGALGLPRVADIAMHIWQGPEVVGGQVLRSEQKSNFDWLWDGDRGRSSAETPRGWALPAGSALRVLRPLRLRGGARRQNPPSYEPGASISAFTTPSQSPLS
jgi:hypothetical protein